MRHLLLAGCELDGTTGVDVRVRAGVVAEVGVALDRDGAEIVDGRGGALLPGLHDHHVHLLATAAARSSVPCGPPHVRDHDALLRALQAAHASAPPGRWLRGTGWHESVGPLDRDVLDAAVGRRPVRVQHRSGAMWVLSTAGLAAVGALGDDLGGDLPAGVERDASGRPTGRLHRLDGWLAGRVPRAPLDLAAVGRELASYGITGVTDATVDLGHEGAALLAAATRSGDLHQHLLALGVGDGGPLRPGPAKIVLDEHVGVAPDALVAVIEVHHERGRPVAIHCVTRAECVLAVHALASAGVVDGDRLEHASVLPPELDADVAALGVRVVTQPGFVHVRGDDYLRDVDPDDRPLLYRCGTLLRAGVRVAAGSDAPFGPLDPWLAIRAAVDRRTHGGATLGPDERVDAGTALGMLLAPLDDPGGPARRVVPGAPADLCLLRVPLDVALADPDATHVAVTVVAGEPVHRAE